MSVAKRVGVGDAARSLLINFKPPGPKAQEFILSDAPVTLFMGPEGCGKTISACAKMQWAAKQQDPSPHDNVVRVKGYIIRDTYRNLWDKTIPSYWSCFPKDMMGSVWTGGKGEPADHVIRFKEAILDKSGRPIKIQEYEMIHCFRAVGDDALDDFAAGLEPTWIYLNEVNTLVKEAVQTLYGRCGRYPAPHDRPNYPEGAKRPWFGVFGDFNAEDEAHWSFKMCIEEPFEGLSFIVAPSGFSPEAENLDNLKKIHPNYYEERAKTMEKWRVKRMIENKWGFSRDGEPVYGEDWNDEIHVSRIEFEPDPRRPVYIGADAGGTPAAVFGQVDASGCLRVFDEYVTPDNEFCDPETFGKKIGAYFLNNYPNCYVEDLSPDPSSNSSIGGYTHLLPDEICNWMNVVSVTTGWELNIPVTNSPGERLGAVRRRLRLNGGFLLSPRCKILRGGFNSGYKLKKANPKDGAAPEHNRIVKNRYSHPHDALQYLAMRVPLAANIFSARDNAVQNSHRPPVQDVGLPLII